MGKGIKRIVTDIKDSIVSILLYLIGGINFLFGSVFMLIVGLFTTGKIFEYLLKMFSRSIVFLGGVRLRIKGRDKLEPGERYILMMNHVNIFDGFLFNGYFPGKLRGIEEESHMSWPVYGMLMKRIGMIPINRKNGRKAFESLKNAATILKEQKGLSIGVMPEGTRTITGKLGKFKKGGFLLAIESGLEIVPIVQIGSYKIKRKTNWIIRPGKVKLVFCNPIPTKGYTRENVNDLMEKVRSTMLLYLD